MIGCMDKKGEKYQKLRFRMLVWRALRLRCALCGQGKLFVSWFRMAPACGHCGAKFEREPGFFLGSIYFNYGLTALIATIAYPVLLFGGFVEEKYENQLLAGTMVFVVLFPMWFFRYARSLWLGFDQFMDPRQGEVGPDQRQEGSEGASGFEVFEMTSDSLARSRTLPHLDQLAIRVFPADASPTIAVFPALSAATAAAAAC